LSEAGLGWSHACESHPQGTKTVSPYLCCKDATAALKFYEEAFGATRTMLLAMPERKWAMRKFGSANAIIMLSDEFPEMGNVSPETLAATSSSLMIYVKDVDAFVAHAVSKGAEVLKQWRISYGDRNAKAEGSRGACVGCLARTSRM